MPAAPTADFSFDRDIAPHASRYFNRVDANPNLSHEAKMRLQGSMLGGVEGIEAQRMKLQEERDQGRARKLDYESSAYRLEQARADRTRLEQMEARRAGLNLTAKSILDGPDDPETKRQTLARTALDYADDPDALKVFSIAQDALPKEKEDSLISNSNALALILDGIPQEEIAYAKKTGDYSRVGKLSRDLKVQHEATVEVKKLEKLDEKDAKTRKLELAKMPLKFAKDEATGEESGWLEDSSTAVATKVVEALGTPAEKARFAKLKAADSDRERALLVELIQLRHRFDTEKGGDGRKTASSVTGL